MTLALAGGAASARAQMETGPGAMSASPLGVPEQRAGSGTSWLPDATSMHAIPLTAGAWTFMTHGAVFVQYDVQGGPRGRSQLGIINWGMLAASRAAVGGRLELCVMLSAEPFTIGARGYPLLLQTGEAYRSAPLADRQYPHDLFMELAALYERRIAGNLAASIYPTPTWSLSTWHAYLNSPEQLPPAESVHRLGAAALMTRRFAAVGAWSAAVIYGANVQVGTGRTANSLVIESTAELNGRNTVFGRAEYVQKSAFDLRIPPPPTPFRDVVALPTAVRPRPPELHLGLDLNGAPTPLYRITVRTLGYVREMRGVGPLRTGLGVRGSVSWVPRDLEATYGSRTPVGASVYIRFRPAKISRGGMEEM